MPGDTQAVLAAHRPQALDWLLAQAEPGDLLEAYDRFLQQWSPVFPD